MDTLLTNASQITIAALLLGALGCGGTATVQEDGGGEGGVALLGGKPGVGGSGGGGDVGGSDVGGTGGTAMGGTGGVGPDPTEFCLDACATTAQSGCLPTDDCLAYCAGQAGAWSGATKDAFAECALNDPLCFITIEGCMLSHLNDPANPPTFIMEAQGLTDYEGMTATMLIDGGGPSATAAVFGGSMSQVWVTADIQVWDQMGPLLMLYIDADQSGTCSAPDFTFADYFQWTGDFDDIVYTVELGPADNRDDWVCNVL